MSKNKEIINKTKHFIVQNIINNNIQYNIYRGKNAQGNWDAISASKQNDVWFHLGGNMSSPHVIFINYDNWKLNEISKNIIYECANICKQYSKYNNNYNVECIYTLIKNITKDKEIVGKVYTKKYKSVFI